MSVLTAEPVWPAESVAIAVNVRVLLQAAFAGIVNVCVYGGVETVPIVVDAVGEAHPLDAEVVRRRRRSA